MHRLGLILATACALSFASPLWAQLTLEDIESTAPAESERVEQLMSALENPDPNYRMHAFQTILEKGSDYERRLALQRAFLGTDVNLRNAALKARLSEMPILKVEIQRPKGGNEFLGRLFGSRPSAWFDLRLATKDLKAGRFTVEGREAYVIDDQFVVSFLPHNYLGKCAGEFGIADDLSLAGPLNCDKADMTAARAPLF